MPVNQRFTMDPEAQAQDARERSAMQHILNTARRYGLRREDAQRFIARQRRSFQRQKAAGLLQGILTSRAVLACLCGMDLRITQTPLTCPRCKRRGLAQKAS